MFCGYILAHLGVEVVAVEPPGGNSARALPPFAGGGNGPESGLWWQAYARGKSSLVLDLESGPGRAGLRALAADADILIESFPGADARRLGLDYETLAAVNPGLVCVSISPFGRTGPKADWPATDLTVWASSGAHILARDDDRAPARTSVPQAFLHAGAEQRRIRGASRRRRLARRLPDSFFLPLPGRLRDGHADVRPCLRGAEQKTVALAARARRLQRRGCGEGLECRSQGDRGGGASRGWISRTLRQDRGVHPGPHTWVSIACQSDAAW